MASGIELSVACGPAKRRYNARVEVMIRGSDTGVLFVRLSLAGTDLVPDQLSGTRLWLLADIDSAPHAVQLLRNDRDFPVPRELLDVCFQYVLQLLEKPNDGLGARFRSRLKNLSRKCPVEIDD